MKLSKEDIEKIKEWRKRKDGHHWCPFSFAVGTKSFEYEKCLICWYIFPWLDFTEYGCHCPCSYSNWNAFYSEKQIRNSVHVKVDAFLTKHKKKYGY